MTRKLRDNAQLVLVLYSWVMVVCRNTLYPREIHNWYHNIPIEAKSIQVPFTAAYFMKIMRILISRKKYPQPRRSCMRSIVFDVLRCQLIDVVYPLSYEGVSAFTRDDNALLNKIIYDSVLVAFMSWTINNFTIQHWFNRVRLLWSILMVEYYVIWGSRLLDLFNHLERDFGGNLWWTGSLIRFEANSLIIVDLVEDWYFGDMDLIYLKYSLFYTFFDLKLKLLKDNLDHFMGYLVGIPAIFII